MFGWPAFGEELGWRGMLFPTLADFTSERSAALVSGVIWGLWHAPAIAIFLPDFIEVCPFPLGSSLSWFKLV
jgi:membrane protease YdiL (CAAX protease family)